LKPIKVLYSSNRNPYFKTFTEYIEKALGETVSKVSFFENRKFGIPGRLRTALPFLHRLDLSLLNNRLLEQSRGFKPDIFLETGGWNILPGSLAKMKAEGVTTVLWTVDAPVHFENIISYAPHYDYVFCQGTEAVEILGRHNIKRLEWLPFACDPDLHAPVEIASKEKALYGNDVSFVGSGNTDLYQNRRVLLEALSKIDLGVWGPGWETLPEDSRLKSKVRGNRTGPEDWRKIYSSSKAAICIHYKDPAGKIPCYQASPRVFEAMACGILLFCDRQKDVLTLFKDRKHLVIFDNAGHLKELLLYYIAHPAEAKTIAEAGRKEVLAKHTFKDRIQELIGKITRG